MATFSSLVVKVSAETKQAERAINDFTTKAANAAKKAGQAASSAMKQADDWTKRATNSTNAYASSVAKLRRAYYLLKFASSGIFVGLGVAKAISDVDKLAKTSRKLGIPVEQLQSLQFAARLAGVGIEQTNLGLQRMVRRVAEAAQGTGEAKNALKELGLDASALVRLSPDQQFRKIAKAMQEVGNQADKVRLGQKLFDSEGVGLINAMNGGLAKSEEMFKKLGISISAVETANIEILSDSFMTLATTIGNTFKKVIAQAGPSLSAALQGVTAFIAEFRIVPKVVSIASTAVALFAESAVAAVNIVRDSLRGLNVLFTAISSKFNDEAIEGLTNEIKRRKNKIETLKEAAKDSSGAMKAVIERDIKNLVEGGSLFYIESLKQLENRLSKLMDTREITDKSLSSQTEQLVKSQDDYKQSFARLTGQAAQVSTEGLTDLNIQSKMAAQGLTEFNKLINQLTGRGDGKQFADQILGKAQGTESVDQQLARALLTDIGNSIAQSVYTPSMYNSVLGQGKLNNIIQGPIGKGDVISKLSGINQTAGSSFTQPRDVNINIKLDSNLLQAQIEQGTATIMNTTTRNDKQ